MKKWLCKYWKWIAIVVAMIAIPAAAKAFLPLDEWMKALSSWVEKLGPFGVIIWVSRIAKNAMKESGAAKKKDDQ